MKRDLRSASILSSPLSSGLKANEDCAQGAFQEDIIFTNRLKAKDFSKKNSFLFIDRNLLAYESIQKLQKTFRHLVLDGGEKLKTLNSLQEVLQKIQPDLDELERPLTFVCIGGGSLGDFCGFLASIYQRGVDFVQCPSTWLSAVDSAHGGKTALNIEGVKNQVGSFYPAQRIIIAKDLLQDFPVQTALGEVLKTLLLAPKSSGLQKVVRDQQSVDSQWLWENLAKIIEVKTKIVRKDPWEKKGLRHHLNFGHTLGHAIESLSGKSHSDSVLWGILFALRWSVEKKLSSKQKLIEVQNFLQTQGYDLGDLPQFTKAEFCAALNRDKKRQRNDLRFVFYKDSKAFVQSEKISSIIKNLDQQGFISP